MGLPPDCEAKDPQQCLAQVLLEDVQEKRKDLFWERFERIRAAYQAQSFAEGSGDVFPTVLASKSFTCIRTLTHFHASPGRLPIEQ